MFVLKGFASNTAFANNTPGVVATIGELSSNSITYSREKGYYSDKNTAPNVLLTSFTSKDDNTSIMVPSAISAQALVISKFVYDEGVMLGVGDATVLLENLLNTYGTVASNFECGEMVSDGANALPEWVSWKCLNDGTHPDNFIKVWFVDASFQQQFDEYEIYVIPPFDVLDNFFKPGSEVDALVKALVSSETMDRIQAAKQGYPETVIRTNTFNYIDPNNSLHTVATDWTVLIYGLAGDNIDSIKDAIMSHILANSARDRTAWVGILPDIFKRTEFIVVPLWENMAIPNKQISTGIYSPQVRYSEVVTRLQQFATQYATSHIDSYATIMGHPYRSIALLSIGSPENRNAQYQLLDVFPDLIAVASSSVDFNRMSQDTQNWATLLETMLIAAESATDFSVIPTGIMKVHRDGILYLAKSFKNITYLVVTKSSMSEAS